MYFKGRERLGSWNFPSINYLVFYFFHDTSQQFHLKNLPAFPMSFLVSIANIPELKPYLSLPWWWVRAQPYETEVKHDIDGGHLCNGGKKVLTQWIYVFVFIHVKLLNDSIGKICGVFQSLSKRHTVLEIGFYKCHWKRNILLIKCVHNKTLLQVEAPMLFCFPAFSFFLSPFLLIFLTCVLLAGLSRSSEIYYH